MLFHVHDAADSADAPRAEHVGTFCAMLMRASDAERYARLAMLAARCQARVLEDAGFAPAVRYFSPATIAARPILTRFAQMLVFSCRQFDADACHVFAFVAAVRWLFFA